MSDLQILTRVYEQVQQIALIRDEKLLEYHENKLNTSGTLVGSIYLGRVERVLKDLGAAFVEIGLDKKGFLPILESDSFQKINNQPLITGQDIVVQVKKDPVGDKGAFLTRDILLSGQYIMLMPNNRFIGVSKRITDRDQIAVLKAKGIALSKQQFGMIMRANALYCSDDELQEELQRLCNQWKQTIQNAFCRKSPILLFGSQSIVSRIAEDYCGRNTIQVFCSRDMNLSGLPLACAVHKCDAETLNKMWASLGIDKQLKSACKKEVIVPNGPRLVIDECEALTVIDVNSAQNVFSTNGSLAYEENLIAVEAIAQQIQLRNLSGIIIVDFINMQNERENQQIHAAMEKALSNDRTKTVVHGFTSLGLLEITRKRMGNSLLHTFGKSCSKCGGSGYSMEHVSHREER